MLKLIPRDNVKSIKNIYFLIYVRTYFINDFIDEIDENVLFLFSVFGSRDIADFNQILAFQIFYIL